MVSTRLSLPMRSGKGCKYPLAVFIGRFQPFHNGHLLTLRQALDKAGHAVAIIGSAWHARTLRNPFLTSEVERMVRGGLTPDENARLSVRGVTDAYGDAAWIEAVHKAVASVVDETGIQLNSEADICLTGYRKDETSTYLSLFPRWSFEETENHQSINATDVRGSWLSDSGTDWLAMVPPASEAVIREVGASPAYAWLLEERDERLARTGAEAGKSRTPLIYTCDGTVTQSGYIMLVTREKPPGKGLLSLPGGFLKPQETSRQTLVWNLVSDHGLMTNPRRSREDTAAMVDGRIVAMELFDHPWRSERGRAVSCSFLVELTPGTALEPLRRGPLGQAEWYPIARLDSLREKMFEDHAHIARRMLSQSRWSS